MIDAELYDFPEESKEQFKEEQVLDNFMTRWRMSEFYSFVMNIVEGAQNKTYLQDIMQKNFLERIQMSNDESREQAKIDMQCRLRIENDIKELLK